MQRKANFRVLVRIIGEERNLEPDKASKYLKQLLQELWDASEYRVGEDVQERRTFVASELAKLYPEMSSENLNAHLMGRWLLEFDICEPPTQPTTISPELMIPKKIKCRVLVRASTKEKSALKKKK